MTAPLKIATAGTGYFSRFHYNGWQRMAQAGDVAHAALCNRTEETGREFAGRYDISEVYTDFATMLDETKPDLVDIITPPVTHSQYVRAAVERGVAVICQKPFTPGYSEAAELVEFISAKQGRVFIHEDFRFQPWYGTIKSMLDDGAVGEPYQMTFWLRPGDGQGPDAYLSRQPYFRQMPRFLVHETAIHLVDTFRYLFGEVTSVYADLARRNPVIQGEDSGHILFEFSNGRRGVFDGNRLSDHPADNRRLTMGELRLEGSDGTLTLDGYGVIRHRAFGSNDWRTVDYQWDDIDYGGDCVYRTNKHIVDHIRMGTPVSNMAADYLINLRIEAAIYQSAESARKIDLAGFSP